MKKQLFTFVGIFFTTVLFAQTPGKIILNKGQKIVVSTTVSISNNMAPGVDASSNSTSENVLEVKQATDKNYTISNTLTKLKLNLDIPGSSTSYDSEKKEDKDTDMGKSISEKLNKPGDVTIENTTGIALTTTKPSPERDPVDANPMQKMMEMYGDNGSDESVVSGAFEVIPPGKKPGDSWSDTSIEKSMKVTRVYTFKSNADSGAVVQLTTVTESTGTMEMMGMNVDVNTTTQTSSAILFDIATGIVKRKSTEADITGNFQLMGQSVPITAKATTVSIYK